MIVEPSVNLEIVGARVPITLPKRRLLCLGQTAIAGTATPLTLYENLETGIEYQTLFGKNSILGGMIANAQAAVASSPIKPQIDAIPLTEPATTVAAGIITFTGTAASADATITVTIGNGVNAVLPHVYTLNVIDAQNPTQIADALAALIVADDTIPVKATTTTGAVTLDFENFGTEGNFMGIYVEGDIPDITIAITATAGGSGTPDLSGVAAIIENIRYERIAMPASYDVATIVSLLETRFNETDPIIKNGTLVVQSTDSLANFSSSTIAENTKVADWFAHKAISVTDQEEGNIHRMFDYEQSAFIAALSCLRLTEGAEISEYVTAPDGANDNFGGIHMSTKPYANTPLRYASLAKTKDEWTADELATLESKGFAVFGNNRSNTNVILGRVRTRYLTNAQGADDPSFRFQNYVDQQSVSREYITDGFQQTYNQYRLTTGDLIEGFDMVNAGGLRGQLIKFYGDLIDMAIMSGGTANLKLFRNNISITIDESIGKATINFLNIPVVQLRDIQGVIQLTFSPV